MRNATEQFQQRLAAIVEDARTNAPRSVWFALHLVNACLIHGQHKLLALHMGSYSGDTAISVTSSVDVGEAAGRLKAEWDKFGEWLRRQVNPEGSK